jgi:hypothetical protein
MDAALFEFLWIESFLKKAANCELVHCIVKMQENMLQSFSAAR